ncbi:MAG TPA: CHRD domain-containing protein [Planctomycetota bacterium]|nr:CHRD domain-containing protein [Planctomycetota bacterium]
MIQNLAPRTLAVALAATALAALAPAQKVAMHATLDGAQEVPPNASPGVGTASVVVDMEADTLTIDLTYTDMGSAEVTAHIHGPAPAGASAGVKFGLPFGNTKSVVWNYAQSDEADILAGLMYVNIHSANLPGGELRGQIVRDPALHVLAASIDGAQEVPPVPTTATGTGHFALDTDANTLTFDLTYNDLSSGESAAHIHGPAAIGANAGVKFTLPLGSKKVGVWNYPQSDEADILAGLMYVNVHTANFPGGEVRGQILPQADNVNGYCTAKPTSIAGCLPTISATGTPSASAGSGFQVATGPVPGSNIGIYFYSKTQSNSAPFQGGTLCIGGQILRTPGTFSGGTLGVCDGAYGIDFNAFVASGIDPALGAGSLVFLQTWYRDPPASFGSGLSAALKFELLP